MKTLRGVLVTAFVAAFALFVNNAINGINEKQDQIYSELMETLQSTRSVDTGLVQTGLIDTGVEVGGSVEVTDNVTFTCTPGEQPTKNPNNYSGNTKVLNDWAVDHNCLIPAFTVGSEIVFTLAKPTTHDNQVHVWFKGLNAYGRLVSKKGDQVISFPLNAVETYNQKSGKKLQFALADKLAEKDVTLQTYVAIFDGNYIENIEITK